MRKQMVLAFLNLVTWRSSVPSTFRESLISFFMAELIIFVHLSLDSIGWFSVFCPDLYSLFLSLTLGLGWFLFFQERE